ncbi:phage portal protein [Pseudoflavonifractor phocaeensis]|uniref:phage tail assembly chaperone n=1 Tax=Pseudoflavonifractor phocaeensis TaxID=1870988 RepID=UPI00313DD99C
MGLSAFLAQNAVKIENVKFAASSRFVEEGKPVEWEIRCISSTEDETLRKDSTKRVPVPGKRGAFTQETDYNLYLGRLAVACTVFPNLNDKELQDSYGVMGADVLLKTMLTPGEYANYLAKVQEVCGYDKTLQDEVDEVKN